ncbi:MAG: O-antigen ligase family protein [Gemmatimonadaceae bacterium]
MSDGVQPHPLGAWRDAARPPHAATAARARVRAAAGDGTTAPTPARQWAAVVLTVIVPVCLAALFVGLRPALTIIVGCAILAALAGLRRPVLGLFAVAVLCTVDAMTRVYLMDGGWLRWNTFNYLLLLVSALGLPFLLRFRNGQLRLLQALALVLIIGLLRTPDIARGMQDVLGLLAVFGLLVYFARAAGEPEMWYWLGIVTGVLGALIGLVFFAGTEPAGRIDPNAWSLSSLTALFAVAFAYPSAIAARRGAVALGALAAVNAGWIFLSGSRGSMLGAACVLVYMLMMTPGLHRKVGLLMVVAMLAVGVSSRFGELERHSLSRVARLLDGERDLSNRTSHRWSLVIGGWRIFESHPVIGVGTGGFIPAWRNMRDFSDIPGFEAVAQGREAHAAWVKVLAENGVTGGLLLALVVASFAVAGWRQPRYRALGVFVSVTIAAIFVSTEFQSKGIWFLAAGALVMLHQDVLAPSLARGADGGRPLPSSTSPTSPRRRPPVLLASPSGWWS